MVPTRGWIEPSRQDHQDTLARRSTGLSPPVTSAIFHPGGAAASCGSLEMLAGEEFRWGLKQAPPAAPASNLRNQHGRLSATNVFACADIALAASRSIGDSCAYCLESRRSTRACAPGHGQRAVCSLARRPPSPTKSLPLAPPPFRALDPARSAGTVGTAFIIGHPSRRIFFSSVFSCAARASRLAGHPALGRNCPPVRSIQGSSAARPCACSTEPRHAGAGSELRTRTNRPVL